MPIQTPSRLKGITHIGRDLFNQQLKYGVTEFFRWGMLNIGGFNNVQQTTRAATAYGGDRSRLRPAKDPRYTDGQVWEGFRSDWVWETGIGTDYVDTQPIRVSGVTVDSTFYPLATVGAFAHSIDYPRGRVIFNTAIATTSTVNSNFSYRTHSFMEGEKPWARELMYDSFHVERNDFLAAASGAWSQIAEQRIQMPIALISIVPRRTQRGSELGGGQWIYQDVRFSIIADNDDDRDKLIDIVCYQKDSGTQIPNKNSIKENRDWPLDYLGSPIESGKTFPQLIAPTGDGGYLWRNVYFNDISVNEVVEAHSRLYLAQVNATLEVKMPGL